MGGRRRTGWTAAEETSAEVSVSECGDGSEGSADSAAPNTLHLRRTHSTDWLKCRPAAFSSNGRRQFPFVFLTGRLTDGRPTNQTARGAQQHSNFTHRHNNKSTERKTGENNVCGIRNHAFLKLIRVEGQIGACLLIFFLEPGSIPGFGTHLFLEKWKKKVEFPHKGCKGKRIKKRSRSIVRASVAN